MEKPDISVIIPTFHEAENIPMLVERIAQALPGTYEVIIVDDDSRDGIEAVIRMLQPQYPVSLKIRRGLPRDLSLSVLDGLALARGETLVVMDGDLSHPPEVIPKMVEEIRQQRGILSSAAGLLTEAVPVLAGGGDSMPNYRAGRLACWFRYMIHCPDFSRFRGVYGILTLR